MTQYDTCVSGLSEWDITHLRGGDSQRAVLNSREHPYILFEGFHAAYVLADGLSHRLLEATHQVVFKPFRCVDGKNCELVEFDAFRQGLQ